MKLLSKSLALILILSMGGNLLGLQASAAEMSTEETASTAQTVTETTTNPDKTITTTSTTTTSSTGENGNTTLVVETDHKTTGTNREGAAVDGNGSSISTTVSNADGDVIASSSSAESTTTITATATGSEGTTTVETTREHKESGNSRGDSYEYEETTTTVTEQKGTAVTESRAKDGTEKTVEVTQPENVTLAVPTVEEDDPATEAPENKTTVTLGDPAGTKVITGDIPEGEQDPEFDYTQKEALQQGRVEVTTRDIRITETTGVQTDLDYTYSTAEASRDNDLVDSDPEKTPQAPDPDDLAVKDGYSHMYWDYGNFSKFGAALVCTEGAAGEEPVFYDQNGVPYYVQADHTIFEKRKLYVDDYYINGSHVEDSTYARWDYIQQFVLVDAKTGQLITTYCADQKTKVQDGYSYIMENVEDADYYDQEQAEMIRSVALNGYWGTDSGFGSLSRMKEKLTASGQFTEAEMAALTDGMAMTATQYAIWTFSNVSNGDKYVNTYYVSDRLGIGRVPEEEKDSVELIFKLYHYLIDLEPTPVENTTADTIINADNFVKDLEITVVEKAADHANNRDADNANDAYVTNLTFALVVSPSTENGDDLVVSVVAEDGRVLAKGRIAGKPQDGETLLLPDREGNYSFPGITLTEGVQNFNITLEGIQNLSEGVYLYTSEICDVEGEDISSQTMVGVASGNRGVNVSMNIQFALSVEDEIVATQRVWHSESSDAYQVPGEEDPPGGNPGTPEELPPERQPETPAEEHTDLPLDAQSPNTGDHFGQLLAVAILSGSCLLAIVLTKRTKGILLSALADTADIHTAVPRRRKQGF